MSVTLFATLRMKRLLLALGPWMVLATAAYGGQVRTADVLYTHFDDVPTRAVRVGDECFVALEDVARWGWQTTLANDMVTLTAEGQTLKIPTRNISGRNAIPIRMVVGKLGGVSDWMFGTDTLTVSSELTEIKSSDGKLRFAAPLGFTVRSSVLTNPNRVVLDLSGVRVGANTLRALDLSSRVNQYKPTVTRLIVETDKVPNTDALPKDATRSLDLDLVPAMAPTEPTEEEPAAPVVTVPSVEPPLETLPLELQQETDSRASLRIALGERITRPAEVTQPDPLTLQIALPGIQTNLAEGFTLNSPSFIGVESQITPDATLLTFHLVRPMGAEVVTQGGTVIISLLKPSVGDGRLAGKVIVIDPGHGGQDGGARSGTVREKDLNLKIGMLIAQYLSAEGATVIMTRRSDVFITLGGRTDLANRSKADLFISNHINSTGGSGSQSGTITFHHKGDSVSQVLAGCIQAEIAKVNKLPNLGVWSDGKIYKNGFAVLRTKKMPGVLIEMGFINHPRDRARMTSSDFQRSVAAAVVRGIKVFLGDAQKKE